MQPGQGYEFTDVRSTPGDQRVKKLYELWAKVSDADKGYREALKLKADADREANKRSCDVGNARTALLRAKEELDLELAVPVEEKRGEPV